MRLRNIGNVPSGLPVQRLVDPYVPLKLSAGYSVADPPLYWRLVDPQFSLVEIGINRWDGRFVSFTVAHYNGELHPLGIPSGTVSTETLAVLPAYSLESWAGFRSDRDVGDIKGEFHDIQGRCRLELGNDSLRVVLFPDPIVLRVDTRGEVVFEFNASNELCALTFLRLGREEMDILNGNFKVHHAG